MLNEYKIYTGGIVARAKDFTRELYRPLKLMLSIVILGIFIILYSEQFFNQINGINLHLLILKVRNEFLKRNQAQI